ncbi:hypothetical protein BH09ACT4_BH09ACT4_10880 [soil metagenome]
MTLPDRLRRIPVLLWIVVPIALAALVAWPLGGWDTATLVSRVLPEYASNQVMHTHRFDVRVDDAWVTDQHPAGYGDADDGEVYLVVRADFTNLTTEPATSSELDDYVVPLLTAQPIDIFTDETYVLVDDMTSLPELNPGLTRRLLLVWTVPDDAVHAGDDLRIDMFDGVPSKSLLFYGLRYDFVQVGYAIRSVSQR